MQSLYGYCRTKLYAYPPSVVVFQVILMMLMLLMWSILMLWVSTLVSGVGVESFRFAARCSDGIPLSFVNLL